MRASLFPATLVALTLVCLSSGFAQDGVRPPAAVPKAAAPAPNGTNVAVIDIAYIFKNHIRFNAQMKQLESEGLEFQGEMAEREKALQALKEGIKEFKVGTPEFQKHEEKLASQATTYQLDVRRREQEFKQREAGIYYDAYVDLEKTVALFAQRNKIGIVLKFNREPIKRDDRNSVMQGLNRPVVYHYGLDITNLILPEVNKGQAVAPAGGEPAPRGNTATRPGTKKG